MYGTFLLDDLCVRGARWDLGRLYASSPGTRASLPVTPQLTGFLPYRKKEPLLARLVSGRIVGLDNCPPDDSPACSSFQ